MSAKIKYPTIGCFIFFLAFIYPLDLPAEYYRYVDKEGSVFYVDDLSKVPPEYRDQIDVYQEKYDHLPTDQKQSNVEQDRQKQKELEIEKQRQLELELQQAAEKEEAERKPNSPLKVKRGEYVNQKEYDTGRKTKMEK